MQVYDREYELLKTKMTSMLDAASEIQKELVKKGVSHVVVGKLPCKGQIILVDGLKFKVQSSNALKGTFYAKILKEKD